MRENPGKNRRGGDVMRRRRSGVLVVFFSFANGGRDLSQHIKAFRSGKGVHVRRVSPVPGRLLRDVSAVRQSAIR